MTERIWDNTIETWDECMVNGMMMESDWVKWMDPMDQWDGWIPGTEIPSSRSSHWQVVGRRG